ncbi:MAG: energy transducer TonB [Acidobacteria bacterium]|nr:energy transducer TonB [Acidobacteriota bacterium]
MDKSAIHNPQSATRRFRLAFVTIFIGALYFITPGVAKGGVQQQRATFGPVVSAYLTGLTEELNELEYQLRHREMSRSDHDRAKQRLIILKRYVERLAAQSKEDLVPELQILVEGELGTLGLNPKPNPGELQVGELLDSQWKFLGIERGRTRFFVFQRIPQQEGISAGNVMSERRSARKIDPQEVIETIVVRDRPSPPPQEPQSNTRSNSTPAGAEGEKSLTAEPVKEAVRQPQVQPPRILHVYLPQYTDKARNNGIEGNLILRALFQSDGRVKDVKVEKALGYGLDQRAIESVKKIGFFPAQAEGKSADVHVQIIYNFKNGKVTFDLNLTEAGASAQGVRP